MHNASFDAVTRSLTAALTGRTTRRGMTRLLAGLALGGPLALLGRSPAAAKKTCSPCKKRKKGKCKGKKPDGTACPGGTCQGGRCCVPQETALICAAGCGTRSDTCGGAVACPCPAGQDCLGNGSCARTCNPSAQNCPTGCRCSG